MPKALISRHSRGSTKSVAALAFVAILLLGLPSAVGSFGAVNAAGGTITGVSSIQFLSLSIVLANKVHDHMLNLTSDAFYFSVLSNWDRITSTQYSTLGNAMLVYGLLQLYATTRNGTYLGWAASTADSFWKHAWAPQAGGFYDTYQPNWRNSTCEEVTQDNAMFEIDFLSLYVKTGSSVWLQRAISLEGFLNSKLWDPVAKVVGVSYDACTGAQSADAQIEVSIGSYLWATSVWTQTTGNASYVPAMKDTASFAFKYLWDGSNNTLTGGAGSDDCSTPRGHLGFMRSVYLSPLGLEDCRKGANENIWGAVGIASLYSVTGNSSLLAQVDSDLNWINATFWDRTNGGYHNNSYRDDSLRSSCASNNDPRDYPGWTEGEQPMFFWIIGTITGNSTMTAWSGTAEKWTAQHQWNYTNGNGGEMTCLDGNTMPDSGSTNLFDWVQASAIYSFSAIVMPGTTTTSTSQATQSTTTSIFSNGSSTTSLAVSSATPSISILTSTSYTSSLGGSSVSTPSGTAAQGSVPIVYVLLVVAAAGILAAGIYRLRRQH